MGSTAYRAALKDRARSILDTTRAAHGVADVHRSAMEAAIAARKIAGGAL